MYNTKKIHPTLTLFVYRLHQLSDVDRLQLVRDVRLPEVSQVLRSVHPEILERRQDLALVRRTRILEERVHESLHSCILFALQKNPTKYLTFENAVCSRT